MTTERPLRIGTLGAARITPAALIEPARHTADAEVVAVAARDPARARAFAHDHGIPTVHASYGRLVDADDLDVVYNPLPISLHCEWTIRALRAGKHVLCEKAIACNAEEAERMAEAARESGRRLVEAFHYRYHPVMERVLEVIASGVLGPVRELDAHFRVPLDFGQSPDDIRFRYELGGGATMDLGCYPIHIVRHAAGAEPDVIRAEARTGPANVDVAMSAELRFPGDIPATVDCAMEAAQRFSAGLHVRGERGELRVRNPLAPHFGHELRIETADGTSAETLEGETTYLCQLRAFADHVQRGTPVPTGPADAIANMRVIDAIYTAAGLPLRGT